MLATPPFGASSNIALWRANNKPPVELVVADLDSCLKSENHQTSMIYNWFGGSYVNKIGEI